MCGITISYILGGVIGFITSVLATWLYTVWQKKMKIKNYAKLYKTFEGQYFGYDKFFSNTNDSKPILELKLERNNNIFSFDNLNIYANFPLEGAIIMDETIPNYGRGYYRQKNFYGFGFIEVQLQTLNGEMSILVQGKYADKGKEDKCFGWIWKKNLKKT